MSKLEEKLKTSATLIPLVSKGSTGFNSNEEEIIFGVNLNTWSDPLNINRNNFQIVQPISKEEESIKDYELVKDEINQTLLEANKLSILERVYASEEDIMLENEFLKNKFSIDNFKVEEFQNINRTTFLSNDLVNIVFSQPNTGKISKELINNKLFIYDVIERSPGILAL